MTALDDALASPSPVWVPPQLQADWDVPRAYRGVGTVDDLSTQHGEAATISHSFDDGLPDTVTTTSGADAGGVLDVDLTGRGTMYAATIGWRTPASGTQLGGQATATWPVDIATDDLVITAFSVVTGIIDITGWTAPGGSETVLIYNGDDGAALGGNRIIVFASRAAPGTAGGSFVLAHVASNYRWGWSTNGVYANQGGFSVGVKVGAPVTVLSGTSGTISGLTVPFSGVRGYVMTMGSTRDTTLTGTDTQLANVLSADPSLADVRFLVQRTGLIGQGSYTRTMTKGVSNAYSLGVGFPLTIDDRAPMDARQYFSPYNTASPVVSYDRDLAPVRYNFGVLTSAGPDYTRLFTGQMSDVPVKSRSASLAATSARRLAMMRSVKPPLVWGAKEGANMSWLLSWVWYQCGLSVSPKPAATTRYWNPLHGSLREFVAGGLGFNFTSTYDSLGTVANSAPQWVDGPFLMGMYGERSAVRTVRSHLGWTRSATQAPFTRDTDAGAPYDMLSQANSTCRVSMWVRGDPYLVTTAYTGPVGHPVEGNIQWNDNTPANVRARIQYGIRNSDRTLFIRLSDDTTNDNFWFSTITLPTDGAWHFVSWSWNWKAGTVKAKMDGGAEQSSTLPTVDGDIPSTDAGFIALGFMSCTMDFMIPCSDIYIDAGPNVYTAPYVRDVAFSADIVTRPLDVALEIIAEPVAREAWGIMVDVALASLSSYRTDELDRVVFAPLSYFGEAAQTTPQLVAMDTESNMADPDVLRDPSRIRNNVTVEFNETRVDTGKTMVLSYSTVISLPASSWTVLTFALDTTAILDTITSPTFTNLTSGQVAAGTIPAGVSFITANTLEDGTGTYMTSSQVSAVIIGADSDSVTIQFRNTASGRRYIVNNGTDVPFMGVLGNAVVSNTGYVTTSDPASIAKRGERTLSASIGYLQRRQDATMISGLLTAMLCGPTTVTDVTVFGDPRRTPGQVFTVDDAQGTSLSGLWRATAITHNRNDAEYTQNISMVGTTPPGVWDQSNWDEVTWSD